MAPINSLKPAQEKFCKGLFSKLINQFRPKALVSTIEDDLSLLNLPLKSRITSTAKLLHGYLKIRLMKKLSGIWLFVIAMAMTLSSCEVVGGIFKAGFYVGIFVIVLIVIIILWLVNRGRRR